MLEWLFGKKGSSNQAAKVDPLAADDPPSVAILKLVESDQSFPLLAGLYEVKSSRSGKHVSREQSVLKAAIVSIATDLTLHAMDLNGLPAIQPDVKVPRNVVVVLAFNNLILGSMHAAVASEGVALCSLEELILDASIVLLARKDREEEESMATAGYKVYCSILEQDLENVVTWRDAVQAFCRGHVNQLHLKSESLKSTNFRDGFGSLLKTILASAA